MFWLWLVESHSFFHGQWKIYFVWFITTFFIIISVWMGILWLFLGNFKIFIENRSNFICCISIRGWASVVWNSMWYSCQSAICSLGDCCCFHIWTKRHFIYHCHVVKPFFDIYLDTIIFLASQLTKHPLNILFNRFTLTDQLAANSP